MKKIFNIIDYGAVGDGITLNTRAVQRAIDDCSKKEGGTVVFPDGWFVLSTVYLKSNVSIEFSENTVVLGSLNFYDYDKDEAVDYPLYQDASHSFFHCSLFVGEDCENVTIYGGGRIDMRSVWDLDNVRNMCCRGAKVIALKNCVGVRLYGFSIENATDLAVYFAGCKAVEISRLKMRVYIDGISPDNSEDVIISDCDVETGDDGIVFKSSYTLNRLGVCKNIQVRNCRVKSRCNALKFGTESNGGFENIIIDGVQIRETRITGLSIESVDGAKIKNITVKNVSMRNVNAPLFIHIGRRMRGPKGLGLGNIEDIVLENITAEGPYEPYDAIPWNVFTWKDNCTKQYPWNFTASPNFDYNNPKKCELSNWQITSNICGLKERPLKNILLKNVSLLLDGGLQGDIPVAREEAREDYPEVDTYGKLLPAKGIFFRYIDGLTLQNVRVKTYREDIREDFIFDKTENVHIK